MHVRISKLRETESVAARPPEGQPASDVRPVEVASVPELARHRPPRTARSGRTQAALTLRLSGATRPRHPRRAEHTRSAELAGSGASPSSPRAGDLRHDRIRG